jgi:hypothetical protein
MWANFTTTWSWICIAATLETSAIRAILEIEETQATLETGALPEVLIMTYLRSYYEIAEESEYGDL